MDNSIVEFLTRHKRDIDKIVDTTFFRLMEGSEPIDQIAPVTNYLNRKLLLLKFNHHKPTVASIVAEEQEIPASRPRAVLSEELFSNLKLGKQLVFTARHFEMMRELQMYLGQAGALATQVAQEIEKYFFGQAADLVPSIVEKMTMLMMKVATTGSCIFTDPLTGAQIELTYPGTIAALLPSALTSTNRWSQSATADPLANLETHARAYYDNLGMFPQQVVLHWSTLRQVADANSTKIAKLRKSGADSTTPDTTGLYITDEEAIALIVERTRSQGVVVFDGQYSEEAANGNVTDKFYLPDDYYFFAKDEMFERAMVPTVEKNFDQGIFFGSEVVSIAPRKERAVAVGNGIPFCADARCIAARKVA